MPATLDLDPDTLLSTTRSVRKRLDLERPVSVEVIRECVDIARQAPSGSNAEAAHFVVVTDPERRAAIAEVYRAVFARYVVSDTAAGRLFAEDPRRSVVQHRVQSSAEHLAAHLHQVPVLVVPCIGAGRDVAFPGAAGVLGSVLPAAWSFCLAARARGLGTCWTTMHLGREEQVAEILGIPFETVRQVALLPVAYTVGTDFRPAPRVPLGEVLHVDRW